MYVLKVGTYSCSSSVDRNKHTKRKYEKVRKKREVCRVDKSKLKKEKQSIGRSEKERTVDDGKFEREKESVKQALNHFLKPTYWILQITELMTFNFDCVRILPKPQIIALSVN